jgi:valyl-tRNA synthetase
VIYQGLFREANPIIQRLARVNEPKLVPEISASLAKRHHPAFEVGVPKPQIDVAAECEKLNKEIAKQEKNVANADRQLGNSAFTAKAPAHIVEGLKKQRDEAQHLLDKLRADRGSLGC